ncbi:hypothetical protein BJX64DRAFT_207978 [Aspergillus heterothallicus]
MSADAQQPRPKEACITCKTRKKKCDKQIPSCGYCVLKHLDCRYIATPRRRGYPSPGTDSSSSHTGPDRGSLTAQIDDGAVSSNSTLLDTGISSRPAALHRAHIESLNEIHAEVTTLIRSTGEFVDDLTSLYFRTFHTHLPIISRTRFQDSLMTSGATPAADASVLLLVICLIAYIPNREIGGTVITQNISRQSLYLATKALIAQVQGSMKPSVALIQATLLLATYEYASGRPEVGLATIASCARLAYTARVHIRQSEPVSGAARLAAEEAWNTWWGIIISERAFVCEASTPTQPLTTTFPPETTRLPLDRALLDRADTLAPDAIPDIPISACLTATHVGGFGRAAQICCLVDRTIKAMAMSMSEGIQTALPLLENLDATLQSSLGMILSHGLGRSWHYCTALAVTLRALYTLHNHIRALPDNPISINFRSLAEWKEKSLAALDATTTMALDMAKWHYATLARDGPVEISPIQIYVVRAAMEHLRARRVSFDGEAECPWPQTAEQDLGAYLKRIEGQWVAS